MTFGQQIASGLATYPSRHMFRLRAWQADPSDDIPEALLCLGCYQRLTVGRQGIVSSLQPQNLRLRRAVAEGAPTDHVRSVQSPGRPDRTVDLRHPEICITPAP
jgi:hypothetical protein